MSRILRFSMVQEKASHRLQSALKRLGAEKVNYDLIHTFKEGDKAYVEFEYKGIPYFFEYTRNTAKYFDVEVPEAKDLFVALVITIEDIVKNALRGIYDFSRFAEGFKALPHIEVPGWAQVLQIDHTPKSYAEVDRHYKELALGAYNPERNPEGFKLLQKAQAEAKTFFNVGK